MSAIATTNAEVIAEFRENGGKVNAPYDNPPPMVLLYTIGARSGREHIVPMRGMPDGDAIDVFGSAHGSGRHPDWYHNVIANPDIAIERGTESIPVHASEMRGAERDAVLARWLERVPLFVAVVERTERVIPVIRLERHG